MIKITQQIRVFLTALIKKSQVDNLAVHSASLAFTTVLALIPLLAIAYFVFDIFGGMQRLRAITDPFLLQNLAPTFGQEIMNYIDQVQQQISGGAIGVFGFVGFFYTSFTMFFKIELSFNHIWNIKTPRHWLKRTVIYFSMITLGPLALALSFYFYSQAYGWLGGSEPAKILVLAGAAIPYLATAILFTLLYKTLPNTPVQKNAAITAGLIAAVVFEFAKLGYAHYATQALGASVYGSLAVLPVFLLWLQLAWLIVLGGAELCYGLAQLKTFRSLVRERSLVSENPN